MLGDIPVPVVETEPDGPRNWISGIEQLDGLNHVDHAVSLRGEVVHLSAEIEAADRELVPIVGDTVVEEDPQAADVRTTARAHQPGCRPRARSTGLGDLDRDAHDDPWPRALRAARPPRPSSRRAGARPS